MVFECKICVAFSFRVLCQYFYSPANLIEVFPFFLQVEAFAQKKPFQTGWNTSALKIVWVLLESVSNNFIWIQVFPHRTHIHTREKRTKIPGICSLVHCSCCDICIATTLTPFNIEATFSTSIFHLVPHQFRPSTKQKTDYRFKNIESI